MKHTMKYPLMQPMQKEEIIKKIKSLSEAYTPEWRFDEANPDTGSVIALIYAQMLKESMDVVNKSMNKHRIAFLNCLDLNLKEAIPAESYVTFEVVPTSDIGVFIPKATKLLSRSPQGEEILFSTCHSLYATTHKLSDIIFTSREQEKIIPAYEKGIELSSLNMKFFDFARTSIQSHRLLIAHPYILKGSREGILKLHFESSQKGIAIELADKERIEWQILTPDGFKKVKAYLEDQEILCLQLRDIPTEPIIHEGYKAYWVMAEVKDNANMSAISLKAIGMTMTQENLRPNVIYVQDREQSKEHFMPFGNPLELYSECYIRCDEALSKHGANIIVNFKLDYIEKENELAVFEEDINYKYIMRKPRGRPPVQKQEIRVDEVLWDYWNGTGWVKLFEDSQGYDLFNGKKSGEVCLNFKCPQDIDNIAINAYEGQWIRLRMLRADNIYTLPSIEIIPVIHDLKISYSYIDKPIKPQKVFIHNNTYTTEITTDLYAGNETTIFKRIEFEKPACFIGLEELPEKSPLSIFFDIKDSFVENAPALTFQYSTLKNDELCFENLKVSDGTKNLKNSGNMIIILPDTFQKVSLFSKERYWIKITNTKGEYDNISPVLPQVQGIYFNTARVINQITKIEKHYITDPKGSFKIKLQERNIIGIQVFVNEKLAATEIAEEILNNPLYNTRVKKNEQGEVVACWVKWQQVDSRVLLELEERNYYIDKVEGEIVFPDNIFVTLPVQTDDIAIEVIYETCNGTKANVEIGTINGLQSPTPFISRVFNPVPAFGSSDFESVEEALVRASFLLENRNNAVSTKDYETIIKTYASSINRVRCLTDLTITGENELGCMTAAILTDDYRKGSHTFLSYKENLERHLLAQSNLNTYNRKLYLKEPIFVELSAYVWLCTDDMEKAYELQHILQEKVTQFFDPLQGYFDGRGWEIGVMPKHNQLDAYLKSFRLDCSIQKIILTARVPSDSGKKEKDIEDLKAMPFAVPVSGEHKIIVSLK